MATPVIPAADAKVTKLEYFGYEANAEDWRICLHLWGVDWEDVRPPFSEWGAGRKHETPLGVLPVLHFSDGSMGCQNQAIVRYVGKMAGLYPSVWWSESNWSLLELKQLKVDEAMEAVVDFKAALDGTLGISDADYKKTHRIKLAETYEKYFVKFEDMLRRNGCSEEHPYILGSALGGMTVADIQLTTQYRRVAMGILTDFPVDFFTKFELVTMVCKNVEAHPKIWEWRTISAERKAAWAAMMKK